MTPHSFKITRYFLCLEFSDFYVNQSLAGQTISRLINQCLYLISMLTQVIFV
ncbi:unnamed protein product [Tenebrio molitor]|nr:unnamed protein product [Tenebrio molitor]